MAAKRNKKKKINKQKCWNKTLLTPLCCYKIRKAAAAAVCDYIFPPSKSNFSIVMTRMPKNESEMINFSYYCSLCIIKCGFNLWCSSVNMTVCSLQDSSTAFICSPPCIECTEYVVTIKKNQFFIFFSCFVALFTFFYFFCDFDTKLLELKWIEMNTVCDYDDLN